MKATRSLAAVLAGGAAALTWSAYRKDIQAARQRIASGGRVIASAYGPIEFATSGDGPPVLVIHGAGGGFDQGLDLGRAFLGSGHRLIAPSRFGYLGTPLPEDASPQAQADAHLRVLDELGVDRVVVLGVSAGGPSAMQFCLRHPERCSRLVLVVPMAFLPDRPQGEPPSALFETVLNALTKSDFLFWSALKVAKLPLIRTLLGTPVEVYKDATAEEQAAIDALLESILPISARAAGIFNDAVVSGSLSRYPLEAIHLPTLVISAADDGYATYDSALYTADQIHDGKFVGFPRGGHLLVGHEAQVRREIERFLGEGRGAETPPAIAV
jgi:pimeloyl-ACP methyl ester carboxylesterase